MARADHRNAWLRQHFGVAANGKDEWQIVNFLQPRGVTSIFRRERRHSSGGRARHLLPRQFRQFPGGHRLRRNGFNPCAFQFGE